MRGYLLDNNIVSFWSQSNANVLKHLAAAGQSLLFISSIALGEIEYGHAVNPATTPDAQKKRQEFRNFVRNKFAKHILPVDADSAEQYGYLRSKVFEKFAPKVMRLSPVKRAEQLTDPLTGHALGFDENDLWMAAQSIAHNLTFATHDRIIRIKEADIEGRLKIEDWTS